MSKSSWITFPDLSFWPLMRLVLGCVVIILTLLQLFSYDEYAEVLRQMQLPISGILLICIPLLQVASLPFLLQLEFSQRLLTVSRTAGLGMGVVWLFLAGWGVGVAADNSGFGGATLDLPAHGLWIVAAVWALICIAGPVRLSPHEK